MKTSKLIIVFTFALTILSFSNTFGQTYADGSTQIIRNTSLISYSADNPDGVNATFTWTVTGGTIVVGSVDQTSPYTQIGTASATVAIGVRWDNTNKTSVNNGSLTVSKTIGALSCPSADHTITVESWVAPDATNVSTTTSVVCSGNAPAINMSLQGNPNGSGFSYRWQIIRVSDNAVVEDQTSTSTSATVSVPVSAITNTSGSNINYRFKLVSLQDAFDQTAITSFTASQVDFTVNTVPVVGPINSSTSLILR